MASRFDGPPAPLAARISADMAVRLAKAFGSTTETWMRLQAAYDIAQAQAREDEIEVERYERSRSN